MKCSALVVLCFLATGVSADAPEIHKGHPRIYITAQQVPALRAKCRGPFRGVFEAMHKADWIMKKRPGTDWSDCTDISYPAFLFLVTGKKQYLDKTREFLDVLSARWPKDQYRTPAWLRVGSQAADWVWGGLTPAEREKYGRALLDMADWVLKHVWRHSDF
ncbi:MAG: hypothetical protein QGD94_09300, partial [Planctomycetia bacterium]|nr:hypothetical protein [Planctomycetia bacterium]